MKIIAIEGPDRVGKFTQANLLVARLRRSGSKVGFFEVPIADGHTHRVIYWMLRSGLAKSFPRLFQAIQVLNRRIFQRKLLSGAKSYDYVVFDRWSLSTYVYGKASGLKLSERDTLRGMLRPDATIVLSGKISGLEARDVYEKDTDLQTEVDKLYRDWCVDRQDACLVSATSSPDAVHEDIWRRLVELGVTKSDDC